MIARDARATGLQPSGRHLPTRWCAGGSGLGERAPPGAGPHRGDGVGQAPPPRTGRSTRPIQGVRRGSPQHHLEPPRDEPGTRQRHLFTSRATRLRPAVISHGWRGVLAATITPGRMTGKHPRNRGGTVPAQRCQGHHQSCTGHWSCDKGSHRPVVRRYASSRWPNRPVHTGCEPPAAQSRTSAYAPAAGHTSREGKGIRGAGTTGPSDPRSARPLAALRDSGGRHSRQPHGFAALARILEKPPRAPPGLATSMPPPSWWTGTPPSRGRDGGDGATTGGTGDEPVNHRRPHRPDGGSGAAGTRVDRAGAPQVVEGCPAPIPTGDRPPASRWRPVRGFPATSSSPGRKGVPVGPRSSVRGTRPLGDDPMERSPAAMVMRRIIPAAPVKAVPSSAIALGSRPDSPSDALARGAGPDHPDDSWGASAGASRPSKHFRQHFRERDTP